MKVELKTLTLITLTLYEILWFIKNYLFAEKHNEVYEGWRVIVCIMAYIMNVSGGRTTAAYKCIKVSVALSCAYEINELRFRVVQHIKIRFHIKSLFWVKIGMPCYILYY